MLLLLLLFLFFVVFSLLFLFVVAVVLCCFCSLLLLLLFLSFVVAVVHVVCCSLLLLLFLSFVVCCSFCCCCSLLFLSVVVCCCCCSLLLFLFFVVIVVVFNCRGKFVVAMPAVTHLYRHSHTSQFTTVHSNEPAIASYLHVHVKVTHSGSRRAGRSAVRHILCARPDRPSTWTQLYNAYRRVKEPGVAMNIHPITSSVEVIERVQLYMYRGADKSLARPGRKQANVSVRTA